MKMAVYSVASVNSTATIDLLVEVDSVAGDLFTAPDSVVFGWSSL